MPWFKSLSLIAALVALFGVAGCSNNPHPPEEWAGNVIYSQFTDDPKSLDPTYSYYSHEATIIDVINLSYFQYQYLKRPVQLDLALGAEMPKREPFPVTEVVDGKPIQKQGERWTFRLKRGIRFQDDPCFPGGKGREITAADIIFAFKRMADPTVSCPVVSFIQDKILGYQAFFDQNLADAKQKKPMDFAQNVEGLQLDPNDPYVFRVILNQPYPQLRFFMAMHFTTPIAHEAVKHYGNQGYARHPVGCGPYMLKEWREKERLILVKNPNYFGQTYPTEGAPGDQEAGLLADAGKPLPFADKVVIVILRETVTGWNYFLQGYLDRWSIQPEQFQQAISAGRDLTPAMKERGIRLVLASDPNIMYLCFNMLDPVVGGYTPEKRKLRQAISTAFDAQEILDLQEGGFGTPAEFLIPPDVFGYDPNYRNPYRTHDLAKAKQLLAEAGYPNGISRKTGNRLVIDYQNAAVTAESRQRLSLIIRQIEQLGIRINSVASRSTVYRDKIDKGQFQLIDAGWLMDYPDPENFLFMLYGPQRRPEGPNSSCYDNPEYNRLFQQMRVMNDTPERRAIIDQMRSIAVEDTPWVYMYHDQRLGLVYSWLYNVKPSPVAQDGFKYIRVDAAQRARQRAEWNQPNFWPLIGFVLLLVAVTVPAVVSVQRQRRALVRRSR